MTDQATAERVLDLLRQADQVRLPGHRHTADHCLESVDELRQGLRALYRDLRGEEPPRHERRAPTRALFPAGAIAGTRARVEHRQRVRARA